LTPHDFVISIEHCPRCDDHHLAASGHDPQEYLEIADEILRYPNRDESELWCHNHKILDDILVVYWILQLL
jgi:protein-disulfide isomerase